ncbi:MAG: S-layer homology domain-containing protein, partial [Defluviitaleaceae bacterium]|nr:S-layer homology domain-containing protein [Defluviitaleaceae bacterium]
SGTGRRVQVSVEEQEERQLWNWQNRYVIGFRDGSFRPENGITRAEMAQMFFNLSNLPAMSSTTFVEFADVSETGWYFEAISYFANRGILVGFPDGYFRPNQEITNAEFAQFAAGVFRLSSERLVNNNSHWADEAINSIFNMQLFNYFPPSYTFERDNVITRSEVVTVINYHLNRVSHRSSIHEYLANEQIFNDVSTNHWAFYQIMEAAVSHFYTRDDSSIKTWLRAELHGWSSRVARFNSSLLR